jgi:hypothetical protein
MKTSKTGVLHDAVGFAWAVRPAAHVGRARSGAWRMTIRVPLSLSILLDEHCVRDCNIPLRAHLTNNQIGMCLPR